MSNLLNDYNAKKTELKQMEAQVEAEIKAQLDKCFQSATELIEKLKELSPDADITKSAEFIKLSVKMTLPQFEKATAKIAKKTKSKKSKKKSGNKTVFKLSDEKANEILDFIGAGEKSTQEIAAMLKTKNASNALTYLTKLGKIVVARKDGLKKFWKKT